MVRDATTRSARRVRAMAGSCPEKDTTVVKMNRNKNEKKTKAASPASEAQRRRWTRLLGAFQDAIHWGLDAAAHLAREYPDEVETVQRVRAFVKAHIDGKKPAIDLDDLVFTFALAMAAFAVERGTPGAFGLWIEQPPIRVTSDSDLEQQWLVQLLWNYEAAQSRLRNRV